MKILTVVGSLRADGFSRKLARAAAEAAPGGVDLELVDGRDLPHYDQDLDGEEKPTAVRALLDRVRAADALLFVTPEYNYGLPGGLKNLVDWARGATRTGAADRPGARVRRVATASRRPSFARPDRVSRPMDALDPAVRVCDARSTRGTGERAP